MSASATEIHPESFTIAVRIRPLGGDRDAPLDVRCVVRVRHPGTGAVHPIGDDLRDALIALEHAAEHFD